MSNTERMDSKRISLLISMGELSTQTGRLLFKAEAAKYRGNIEECGTCYDQLEKNHLRIISFSKALNKIPGLPYDIKPIVSTLINTLFMHADILRTLKRFDEADQKRTQAIDLSRKHMGAAGDADAERARAAALIQDGRFNEAFIALSTAKKYFEVANDLPKVCRTSLDMVDFLQWMGDYKRALDLISDTETFIKNIIPRPGLLGAQDQVEKYRAEIEVVYYRGIISKYVRDYDAAEKSFLQVLPHYESMGVGAAIRFQLAAIAAASGKTKEALTTAKELEPVMRRQGLLRPKLAALLRMMAEIYFQMGNYEKALKVLQEGLSDIETFHDLDLQWKLDFLHARILDALNRKNEAAKVFSKSIDCVMNLRRSPLGYRLDTTYLNDKIDLFDKAIIYAAENHHAEYTLQFMDAIKSRTLKTVLASPSSRLSKSTGLEDEFVALNQKLDANEYALFSAPDHRDQLKKERSELLRKRMELIEHMRIADPRWRNLSEPRPLDVDQLQAGLKKDNQAILSLYYTKNKCISVLVTPVGRVTATMDVKQDAGTALGDYAANLRKANFNAGLFDPAVNPSLEASEFIPDEMLANLLMHHSVIIVPHGVMHLLPWSAMIYKGKRLFEYCAVGILPNAASYLPLKYLPSANPQIMILGPPDYPEGSALIPLPAAREEAAQIADLYKGRRMYPEKIGKDLTEKAFWDAVNSPACESGVMHFCGHGGIETGEPMNSGLYLCDGKADAGEITRVKIPCAEVVLSACYTGWRPTAVGDLELVADEILSIPGAFLEAGARSILVSIPPAAEKASRDFMIAYHTQRSSGKPPLDSFRATQLRMLELETFAPSLWTGLTMYGCQ